MRTDTIVRTLYKFKELSPEAQEKAVQNLSDINVNFDWWEFTYEDARNIGLEITGFELDRNRHATGDLLKSAPEVCRLIMQEHGQSCATYQTAEKYLKLFMEEEKQTTDQEIFEYLDQQEFLDALLEDYSVLLQQEYDYLTSSEAIEESINANDYEFTESGDLA